MVDVLILIDSELDSPQARERIISQKLDGDAILALSGSDVHGRGVPVEINIIEIDTVNVPSAPIDREKITLDNFDYASCRLQDQHGCPGNPLHTAIVQKREAIGADVVALFVDPVAEDRDPCGFAGRDLPGFGQTDPFFNRFSLQDIKCTNAQFVFLHEILHNFGVSHEPDDLGGLPSPNNLFRRYALGVGPENRPIASVMGCSSFGVPSDTPNSLRTCNRVMRVSDPDEVINGFRLGIPGDADVFRYLSECDLSTANFRFCARERMANARQAKSQNMPPQVAIVEPLENEPILTNMPTLLDAQVNDDNLPVSSVTWSARKLDVLNELNQIIQTLTSEHPTTGWSITTSFFQNEGVGRYLLNATAVDSAGRITTDSRELHVVDQIVADISVELSQFGDNGIETTIRNSGPFTGENITVQTEYGLSGVIYNVIDIQFPSQCSVLPTPPDVQCPNSHCSTTIECVISSLQPGEEFKVIQEVCAGDGNLGRLQFFVSSSIVQNLGPVDNNASNNSMSIPFSSSCGGGGAAAR